MITRFKGAFESGFYRKINNGYFLNINHTPKKIEKSERFRIPYNIKQKARMLNFEIVSKLKISRKNSPIQICQVQIDEHILEYLREKYNLNGCFQIKPNFITDMSLITER